jgi:hypothetical protein
LEDVVLTLRGLQEVPPSPGVTNLMWVISHPDDVTPWEAAGYDRVFAASESWASERSRRWGIPIEPLLQCTDTQLFRPSRGIVDSGADLLFVGNARSAGRLSVDYALKAGLELSIFGGGWEGGPASKYVAATYLPNEDLGIAYASSGIVLNDHWGDMAVNGFLSNRLFDAVASGARVLSDAAVGAEELFRGSVRVFQSPQDLADLVRSDRDQSWAGLAVRLENAEWVRREHSFDHRARQLLDAALQVRNSAPPPPLSVKDGSVLRRW